MAMASLGRLRKPSGSLVGEINGACRRHCDIDITPTQPSTLYCRRQGRSLSSSRAPFRLRLTAAQNGLDPLTHYWFKSGQNDYRRICDSGPWVKGLRYKFPLGRECLNCRALDHTDKMVGKRAFSLTRNLKGIFAPRQEDVLYLPGNGLGVNEAMRQVSIATLICS